MNENNDLISLATRPVLDSPKSGQESLPGVWNKITDYLRTELNAEAFDLWIKPVIPILYENGKLTIEVPNRFYSDWIRQNSQAKILAKLKEIFDGDDVRLDTVLAQEPDRVRPAPEIISAPVIHRPVIEPSVTNNYFSKYTFENFISGQSNRFAKAAAEGVSKEPGIRFNPLFLYGGVGLGKTHLMHAIGHAIHQNFPGSRVLYTPSEKFINEFIDSIRFERPADFRNKYRNLDCLLIDDIQFIMGKDRSVEEFFYTFNSLFDSRKQIVICSDRHPKELGELQDRLISRFESGVVADVQPPDLETRIAILRRKAESDGLFVPEDVIHFVASQIKSNIRELEGSLIRIVAFSSLTGTPLTIDSARETLKDILSRDNSDKPITIDLILEVVAKHFNVEPKELKVKRRTDAIVWPRQISMYLARTLTELSTTEIGEFFGGKDHTTVLHSCVKVKQKLAESPFISTLINKITQDIKNGGKDPS